MMLAASAASDISPGWMFAGVAGVLLEAAGIDATQFHLFSPGFIYRGLSSKTKPRESAGVPAGAKAARSAGIRTARA